MRVKLLTAGAVVFTVVVFASTWLFQAEWDRPWVHAGSDATGVATFRVTPDASYGLYVRRPVTEEVARLKVQLE